jgi:hypothetical protein
MIRNKMMECLNYSFLLEDVIIKLKHIINIIFCINLMY